ncbi:ABC transporter ATP-binding protein/permease [Bombilactobacillus thymidiniphilus]|uniref:ABC transporter ATP-binding protein/permease n=1 Tax=Bombilactobacillus thymidiniphilus TaxID=2923363 RepID=A0ABY4PF70_9LACO|nr:ABC transporter ATP-binding protein/permease [Bombilactobacillus thymidiniphilus]UQS84359.1 ABC transporter ATP-binding protein/permease [Bombilactobacillus thymidiniphilus]
MLQLKNIKKYFTVGDTTTKALDDVSVAFRSKEFVSILGPSGSGKTTMLNIIGGLDRYDAGDLIIDGKSTSTFKDKDWDAYRNNTVGFIFQNYNIISHLSIMDNVTLGMTLSGVSNATKQVKAQQALERVGLKDHINKKPSQLSGGQLQRVAIARALANDPQILLADEPTGALDTKTSEEIMNLIQDLAKERLVIMVTHNPQLAKQYSDRIIEFSDGKITNDSNPYQEPSEEPHFNPQRTKMSFWTALKLSFTNIKTKKGRTFLTIFASSIGIISIGVVLSLSNGFQKQINSTQSEALAQMPITISQVTADQKALASDNSDDTAVKGSKVVAQANPLTAAQHINKITPKYVDYIHKIKKSDSKNIAYTYTTGMNLIRKVHNHYQTVSFATSTDSSSDSALNSSGNVFPVDRNGKQTFLKKNYHVLAGRYPTNNNEIILITDKKNHLNLDSLKNLGFQFKNKQTINPDKILNHKIQLIANDDFYTQSPIGNFAPNSNYEQMAHSSKTINLKIVGIMRSKSQNSTGLLTSGVAYSDQLTKEIVNTNKDSQIAVQQAKSDTNVITGQPLKGIQHALIMTTLGANTMPSSIQIYPNNFQDKKNITRYLDKYNKHRNRSNQVMYMDLAGSITSITGGLMDAITYVLIGFAAISLVTSMIMIAIITYTSVIERTKEIGVLRALGARKKDITRVFDAETTLLGLGSGILGVLIAWLFTLPANVLLTSLTGLNNVAQLNPVHAIVLIIISTILTVLGGHIPAKMASKKDAATALRSE